MYKLSFYHCYWCFVFSFLAGFSPKAHAEFCKFSAYPVPVVFYTPETDLGLGVGYPMSYKSGSPCEDRRVNLLVPAAIYTSKQQTIGRLFSKQYFDQENYFSDLSLSYNHYPDRFYGIGDATELENEEIFTERYAAVMLDFYRRVYGFLYFGVGLGRDVFSIENIEGSHSLEMGQVFGSGTGIISGASVKALYNSRDNEFQPRIGSIIELGLTRNGGTYGGDFNFVQRKARARSYFPMSSRIIAAVDIQAETNQGEVPFRKLAQIGGQYFIRGYFLGRYRDRSMVGAQFETRVDLDERWSWVQFVGVGKVAPQPEDIGVARGIASGGTGVRYLLDLESRINLRLDFAAGGDSRAIYFGAGEAF